MGRAIHSSLSATEVSDGMNVQYSVATFFAKISLLFIVE